MLELNKWQHFAMSLGGNQFKIYIDGVVQVSSTANQPRAVTRTTAYIGRANWNDGLAVAYFDDLKIFNRSLTDFELKRVMNSYY